MTLKIAGVMELAGNLTRTELNREQFGAVEVRKKLKQQESLTICLLVAQSRETLTLIQGKKQAQMFCRRSFTI